MRIFVDADGCPVTGIAVEIAKELGVPITLVKNHAHKMDYHYPHIVTVDTSADSADFYIVNHTSKGDLVITQDNGLAAMCIGKGAMVVNQNGLVIDNSNIDGMLSSRHVHRELRSRGIYKCKAAKRKRQDDMAFESKFRELLADLLA